MVAPLFPRPLSRMKRKRSEDVEPARKRQRLSHRRLLELSDEILLRAFHFLDIRHLTTLDRVSRRVRQLSCDSELWKRKYIEQWLEPRARRIHPSVRPSPAKLVKWLEHGEALRDGAKVDWKRQYRIRNNWENGDARLQEVEVAKPLTPPVLARAYKGRTYTADVVSGLRVWSQDKSLEASIPLDGHPTALAVDGNIVVGFGDGHFEVFAFESAIRRIIKHQSTGCIALAAISMPYLVTMTRDRDIHLYEICDTVTTMACLHADSPLHPAALSLRCTPTSVIATIAYAFNRLNSGWCLGLQEISLSASGLSSRTASNISTLLDAQYTGPSQFTSRSACSPPLALNLKTPPTSLSYSHPYLLASLADNTIMSYIVQSDAATLSMSSGRRLFGHTSAITSAEVSNRGKAVSVSGRGDEIRVWELEEMMTTLRARTSTRVTTRDSVVLNMAEVLKKRGIGVGLALQEMKKELALTRRSVSFDEERVVVVGERGERQVMQLFDFSV